MSIKLPPKEVMNEILDIFEESGVRIPQKYVEITVAAMNHWLEDTPRGHEYMAHLLRLDHIKGKSEKCYEVQEHNAPLTREIKPESIVFLRGCVAQGEVLPLSRLTITDRIKEDCVSCGARTTCVGRNKSEHCSHCTVFSENVNEQYNVDITCEDCTDSSCVWHPINKDLPPEDYAENHYASETF